MLNALRQRNFLLLWMGGFISTLGDYALYIALPYFIYQQTGSALATGGVYIANAVPGLLFGSLGGVFADRWDRKKILIITDIARAMNILILIIPAISINWIWVFYIIAFIESSISMFFLPAKNALIPVVVRKEQLVNANTLDTITGQVITLVGPVIGGVGLALFGMVGIIILDSMSYLLSALLLVFMLLPKQARLSSPETQEASTVEVTVSTWRKLWKEWIEGLRVVRSERITIIILIVSAISMIGQGIYGVLIIPFVQDLHQGTAIEFGWVITAQSIGGVIGGLLIPRVSKLIPLKYLYAGGCMLLGSFFIAAVNVPSFVLSLILFGCLGMVVIGCVVGSQTLLQQHVNDQYRGRVFGLLAAVRCLALIIGLLAGSLLGKPAGIQLMLTIGGAFYFTAGVYGAVTLRTINIPLRMPETQAEPDLLPSSEG